MIIENKELRFIFDKNVESIVIPEGVEKIKEGAFRKCNKLKSITLPSTLRYIDSFAFSGCKSINSIVIPEGVVHIWDRAFYECEGLLSVTLPRSLSQVGNSLFDECRSLVEIVNNSLISMESEMEEDYLKNVYLHYGKSSLFEIDGIIFLDRPDCKMLAKYPFKKDIITLPELKEKYTIAPRAFNEVKKCMELHLNESIVGLEWENLWSFPSKIILMPQHCKFNRIYRYSCYEVTKEFYIKPIDFPYTMEEFKELRAPIVYEDYIKNLDFYRKLVFDTYFAVKEGNKTARLNIDIYYAVVLKYLIENNRVDYISMLIEQGYFNLRKTDFAINYALEKKNEEIKVMLIRYKNEKLKTGDNLTL